jgi:LPS O-antigen subunit length determinant protein (WzzB/FepE family)
MSTETSNQQESVHFDDEIDLREIFGVLWAGKFVIVAITLVFAVISVFYALSIPNQYRAEALLAPAESSSSGLSGALGQLGGLASLAGVSVGGGQSNEAKIAQEIMKSWSFIDGFVGENDLAAELVAANGWSKETNRLEINGEVYSVANKQWLVEEPTSWQLFRSFSGRLGVTEDSTSGLLTVAIEYYSPEIAKRWLDLYVSAINKHMQNRQLEKVSRSIEHLEAQLAKTSVAEMQEVYFSIIEQQAKKKMLAEASPEYVFVAVSPSMIPVEKSQPKRATICILGTLFGGFLSVVFVLLVHFGRKINLAT